MLLNNETEHPQPVGLFSRAAPSIQRSPPRPTPRMLHSGTSDRLDSMPELCLRLAASYRLEHECEGGKRGTGDEMKAKVNVRLVVLQDVGVQTPSALLG